MTVDLDDLNEFDPDLAEAVQKNTRSCVKLISDIVYDLLPIAPSRTTR